METEFQIAVEVDQIPFRNDVKSILVRQPQFSRLDETGFVVYGRWFEFNGDLPYGF